MLEALASSRAAWPAPLEQACRWYEAQLERLFEDARVRLADIQQLARIAATLPEPGAVPHGADAATAGGDQRRGCDTAARRGLPHPVDHPFSEGAGEWTSVTLLNAVDGCHPVGP